LRHHVHFQSQVLSAARTDLPFTLGSGRGYDNLTLICETDNVRSDAILNAVSLVRDGDILHAWEDDQLRSENYAAERHSSTSVGVGVYNLPFVRDGHWEDLQSIRPDQEMKLVLDVANPSGTNVIKLYEGYFGD
jgi:hypothetical protein